MIAAAPRELATRRPARAAIEGNVEIAKGVLASYTFTPKRGRHFAIFRNGALVASGKLRWGTQGVKLTFGLLPEGVTAHMIIQGSFRVCA